MTIGPDVETVTLSDPDTGSTAKILAGFGFNCFEFLARDGGTAVEVIWSEPGFDSGTKRPSGSGIPILFPFPGRIKGTTLRYEGRQYELPEGDGLGNAIHGFVHGRPWRVIEQSAQRVVGQFQASVDEPALLDCWPADFRITAAYQLSGNELRGTYTVENPDRRPLPCGLGTHPYFRVPLGEAGSADECIVKLPISSEWELAGMNATGRLDAFKHAERYRRGLAFGEANLDNVFSGLTFDDGTCSASVIDPKSGRTVTIAFDRTFRECVVYTPPHRQAVCIEPYTCVPDPFRLAAEGVDAGLRVLQSGESFTARVDIRVE